MLGFAKNRPVDRQWARRRIAPIYADGGMVAAAHPLITSAGLESLLAGGNAVDAAIAAAAVAAVVMPEMCGLGGDLFAIVHDPAKHVTRAFLGSGISARAATIEQMRAAGDDGKMPYRGPHALGVPGMVDAYFTMLAAFGTRTFANVAQRAMTHASDGYPLTQAGSEAISDNRAMLASFPASAAVFLPGGEAPAPGARLKQTDLAKTLRTIAEHGPDVFYRGSIGKAITDFLQANGGAMTLSDFAGHATQVIDPISTTYRGYHVFQTGVPSQGLIQLEALNILEQFDLTGLEIGSPAWIHRQVEAKKLAYADRLGYVSDDAVGLGAVSRLLDKGWAATRAHEIDRAHANPRVPHGEFKDGDTTYLCVVDGAGMMVSLIQSVSAAFGCGMVAGETGVVMNNRVGRGFSLVEGHPNVFTPGKRTMHTLNCFMIADEDGKMVVTGGTPGGDGQPQWNLQMTSALIDAGLDAQASIEVPRWTSWPGTDPDSVDNPYELRIESRAGETVIAGLAELGHKVVTQREWTGGGTAQIIARDPNTGVLAGATDPREEGEVLGF